MVRVLTGLCSQTDSHTSCDRLHLHHVNLTTVYSNQVINADYFVNVQMLQPKFNVWVPAKYDPCNGKYFYL